LGRRQQEIQQLPAQGPLGRLSRGQGLLDEIPGGIAHRHHLKASYDAVWPNPPRGASDRRPAVRHIHRNPEKHGLIPDFREWPWSSYGAVLAERPARILRDDVLAWFGGRAPFIALHQTDPDKRSIASTIIE
jgi:hypothetical protein